MGIGIDGRRKVAFCFASSNSGDTNPMPSRGNLFGGKHGMPTMMGHIGIAIPKLGNFDLFFA